MMKNSIAKIFCTGIVVMILLLSSCKKEDTVPATVHNMDEVINTNPEFSMFAYAVKKANLDIFTKGGGPFTFFIPDNNAFSEIGLKTTADIDKLDPLFLALLTTYHFQGTKRTFYEIPEGPNATMSTQTGVVQYGTRNVKSDKAYINGIELLDKGTQTSNGLYYNVGEVIQPPYFSSALVMMEALGNYSLMLQAIAKTSTTTSFTTTPSTVFAIPNSVMLANGYDSTAIANITGAAATVLTNTLRYHVIPQRIFKSDFKPGSVLTRYSSNSVVIEGAVGSFTIKGKNNASGVPVGNGIATGSGVFYAISQMLKP
ncbi:fasciclin domain-containing protein [Niabella sp. CC-SYL272]|uniref:fasciclin domain-containing protein n=1 Tax=Niabella agricola TaxID=2891571 RepID=UPI001F1C7CA1|nr:fasciclin domain-containing protein [Niabella agricola]MCF3109289.1 fasciclin domain-containing protein [Niabella agricola]